MKWVTTYQHALHVQHRREDAPAISSAGFCEAITPRAVHELLFNPQAGDTPPLWAALTAIRAATTPAAQTAAQTAAPATARTTVWIDAAGTLYPPAVTAGLAAGPLCIVRPGFSISSGSNSGPGPGDVSWAMAECLRCRHVAAVVSLMMHRPTRVEVRRLQLAAEQGGGVGILLRPNLKSSGVDIYAAATRWLVTPAPGERTIQRWTLTQLHGHGRRTHSSFVLEKHRATGETHFVHPPAALADRPLRQAMS